MNSTALQPKDNGFASILEVLAAIARIAIDESIVVGPMTFLAVNVDMSFDDGTKPIREVMAIPENRNPS